MALAPTKQQINRRLNSLLKLSLRELTEAGVTAKIEFSRVTGQHNGFEFEVYFRYIQASNGEGALLPTISLTRDGERKTFAHLAFRLGIKRLLEGGEV